jgi:beta-xylosidase
MSIIIFCLLLLLSVPSRATPMATATVSNIKPHLDQNGNIMDLHDGNTFRVGNTFFWYGAGYGDCTEMASGCASIAVGSCGFNLNHTVNLATSTDLVNWNFHGNILPSRPTGILFSPFLARSNSTGMYVLWFNLLPVVNGHGDFDHSCLAVAASASPYGPFKMMNNNVTGLAYKALPDGPALFVDDDGMGYIAFTHEDSHINLVQQLSPDLYTPLPGEKTSAQIGQTNNEGILMFKRKGLYYIMFGPCCCFCAEGSTLSVFTATSPLGPYHEQQNPVVLQNTWHGQTGSVWFTGVDYVLYGDRWQSAPDKIKAHDFSYWAPLIFNDNGSIQTLSWEDTVHIKY